MYNDTNFTADGNVTAPADEFTPVEWVFYIANGVVGAWFNAIVLYIAFRYIDTDDKPRQLIVINMTAADLLFCIVYMITRPVLKNFPEIMCAPYYATIWTVQLVSCVNLVWLNVDKLIFIQFPLHYYQIVSRARLLVLMFITWAVLIGLAVLVVRHFTFLGMCLSVSVNTEMYSIICIMYVIMILASFIISGIIFVIAQMSAKMDASQRSKMHHRLFFLFSSTLWTFITYLPYRMLYLCSIIWTDLSRVQIYRDVTNICFKILVIGTLVNPLITIVTQRIYRLRLLKMIEQIRGTKSSDNSLTGSSAVQRGKDSIAIQGNSPLIATSI